MSDLKSMPKASGDPQPPDSFAPRHRSRILFAAIFVLFGAGHCSILPADEPPDEMRRITTHVYQLIKDGMLKEARGYVQVQAENGAADTVIASSLLVISRSYFSSKDYETSLQILKEIVERYKDTKASCLAWCEIGKVYHHLGDKGQTITALERAFASSGAAKQSNITDASYIDDFAYETLGNHYMQEKEWAKAAVIWQTWKPSSWCGTCDAFMEAHKHNQYALCQLQLGNHSALARVTLDEIRNSVGIGSRRSSYSAYLLYRLYEQAGQKEELLRIARSLQKWEQIHINGWRMDEDRSPRRLAAGFPAHAILYCEELNRLAETGDYDGLLAALCPQDTSDYQEARGWPSRAAADAFARCGKDGVAFIQQAIGQDKQPRGELLYALARSSDPEAVTALMSFRPGSHVSYKSKVNLYLALRLKEPDTSATLLSIKAARPALVKAMQPEVDAALALVKSENSWPAPKRNSLPTEIDLTAESLEKLFQPAGKRPSR